MHTTLINRLARSSQLVFILGAVLLAFLCVFSPETSVVTDRQGELTRIDAMTDLTTLKTHAELLAMQANTATNISKVLLGASIINMTLFVALSTLNLIWLRRLVNLDKTHAN